MGEVIAMSQKERARFVEMEMVAEGKQSLGEAARRLGLSYRQGKRVWRRYREGGASGLVHRARGRPSNRCKGLVFRQACLEVYRERLMGFGPTLAAEKLGELGWVVDHETLRRWLVAEGLWQRQRKRGPHRRWRERKAHFGELVQLDGSFHDWFGDGKKRCLMNMVDDATGRTLALLFEEETTEAAMRLLWAWIERYGIPRALYTDWKNVYLTKREPTLEEQLSGEVPQTAFGKVCAKLGITIIPASSPQAKGRVERSNGVYQDRFIKELRLLGITEMEKANELLLGGFCEKLNQKFAHEPATSEDWHRPVPEGMDLADIFCWEETRVVNNDWTVRYHNRWFQITGPKGNLPPAKKNVLVQRRLDGSLHLIYRGQPVVFHEIPGPQPRTTAPPEVRGPKREPYRPGPDHPWRRWSPPRAAATKAQSPTTEKGAACDP